MRRIVLCLLGAALLAVSCLKRDTDCKAHTIAKIAPAAEEQQLTSYLSANGISATKHGSNMYYEIVQQGNGEYPQFCSILQVSYTGTLNNGSVFEQNNDIYLKSWLLIDGWKIGMPMIKKGGRIKLYIPPSLGYGNTERRDAQGNLIIPANSILIYDISLHEIQ